MTTIYLIRHAEQLKIDGIKNLKENEQLINEKIILSEKGEEQDKKLSKNKELQNIDVLWSSNYARAVATAKYIANQNKIPINIDENLGERKLGDLNELQELGKNANIRYTEAQILNENLKTSNGESRKEVSERMTKCIKNILSNNKGKRIAIVSHGASIKFFLANWCEIEERGVLKYNGIKVDVASPCIIKMLIDEEKIELFF